jgi:hypothetical protein
MDDEVREPVADPSALDGEPIDPDPYPDPVAEDAAELRRLIDAGAGSPEELRALAERIKEHRALEESRWRSEVKPSLMASKKWRNRAPRPDRDEDDPTVSGLRNLKIGAGLLVGVLVLVLLATQSSPLWILVPVIGVLVYAYVTGRQEPDEASPPD